jgi:phosphoribosylanthranilate isomerase
MKIKICGLFREGDIDYVNEALPDFIGFVFAKSRRQVSVAWAEAMRPKLRAEITPVGVFVNEPLANVAKLLKDHTIDMAQLHGSEDESYIKELRSLTGKPIIKAVRVLSREDIQNAEQSSADFLLLDNGSGGSGKSFDWNLVGQVQKPFFLAGGLTIDNIEQAIKATNPYAADLSSGVETDGKKDKNKILEIVRRIKHD